MRTSEINIVFGFMNMVVDGTSAGFYVFIKSNRLNEHIKSSTSAIYNHIHETKHNINFTSPHILANDQVKLRLQIKETLHIKEQTAYKSLNQNTGSFPLMLW